MKIYISFSYYDWDEDSPNFHIKAEDDYDIEILSKYIKVGDYFFVKRNGGCWYLIRNVRYVNTPMKMIEITGLKYHQIEETIYIKPNMEIELQIDPSDEDRIEKLENLCKNINKFERYKKAISTEHIQNEGFRILHEYMNKKPYQVIYGNDVLLSMKKELVKVIFVSWKFIKTQNDKIINTLTKENHKSNNANIVVVWKYNENYDELKSLGGIIGVLY